MFANDHTDFFFSIATSCMAFLGMSTEWVSKIKTDGGEIILKVFLLFLSFFIAAQLLQALRDTRSSLETLPSVLRSL